jgi:hypothetical protein
MPALNDLSDVCAIVLFNAAVDSILGDSPTNLPAIETECA